MAELQKKKLFYVRKVRKNKIHLSTKYVATERRVQFSSWFGFTYGKKLVSYVSNPKKNVNLVRTLHNDTIIDQGYGTNES